MALWTDYTIKDNPDNEDTLMVYDEIGNENKQVKISDLSKKIVNDALQKELDIETENKTIPSSVNELHGDIEELVDETLSIPRKAADAAKSGEIKRTVEAILDGTQKAGDAKKVNGHTVNSDVPENAVFTDTVYDDTKVREDIGQLRSDLNTLNEGGLILKEDFIGRQVDNWLDEHPEATTTVEDRSITENKLNENLISNRMPVKHVYNKDVTLSSGRFTYENCNINNITVETNLYGSHIFKDCTIGTLFIESGYYEFINCTFDYIKIVNSTAVFKGCKGNSIYLTGNCDNSIIDSCELTAKNHGTIVINGGISNNVKISNNKIINKQSTILSGIELQCINTHGVSNSIIENNYCETDTNRTSIDVSGHSSDENIRSFNNVIRNNHIVNGNIAIYASKNVIVIGNFVDGNININGEYIDNADYGYVSIKNNTISNTITVRTQSGNPIQKILVDGNIILGKKGITCDYAFPETMLVYLLGNTFNGDAVSPNEYGKKIKLPTEMVYVKENESIYIPKCYVIKSELSEQLPEDSFFNGGIVTNTKIGDRFIIYSKVNIKNGQKRLWTQ